jgi:NADH-quinone oxidoreductase subunit G
VLLGLEPEDEAATIFLRLRKAAKRGRTRVVSVAPFTSRGLAKMKGRLVPAAPGAEVEAIGSLRDAEHGITKDAIILVGERLAQTHGALSAAADLAAGTGARLAWVPRRAGDRGAVEAGALPTLLPGGRPAGEASARVDVAAAWGVDSLPSGAGRDGNAIVAALAKGDLGGLVVGGVDPDDTADPAAFRAALDAAGFVVSLELRETDVTRVADVVLPVAPVTDKAGTFVTWDGRPRSFDAVFSNPASLPDLRVLAGIADELAALGHGRPLGFRTVTEARAEMQALGPWDGARPALDAGKPPKAPKPPRKGDTPLVLATWKQLVDLGAMQDGEDHLRATARTPVARVSRATYESALGMLGTQPDGEQLATITGDRGSVTLPVVVADLPDGVVWVPARSFGRGVLAELASPGSPVTLKGASQ